MHLQLSLPALVAAVVLLLPSVAATACYANFNEAQFPHCSLIDNNFALHWAINNATSPASIVFGVDVNASAFSNPWVGLGISENGGMSGADLWILKKNASGSYVIQDSYALTAGYPIPDTHQDAQLLEGPQKKGDSNTVFTFSRPLDTCDQEDATIQSDFRHHIIWAFGESADSVAKHDVKNRGNTQLVLHPTKTPPPPFNKALYESIDIVMPSFHVPAQTTNYNCTHVALPFSTKRHVVAFEGISSFQGSLDLVHHIVMWACPKAPNATMGDVYECLPQPDDCQHITFVWAPGAGVTEYPSDAGFPAGPGDGNFLYYSLQVHYNNPTLVNDVVDQSGLRLYYTDKLRENDIGMLLLGDDSDDFVIPGNSPDFTSTRDGICPATCTNQFVTDLKVVFNFFHMHGLGYNMSTRVIRDGNEITPLGIRKHYDYHFQGSTVPIDPHAVIKRGDTLITKCTFIATDASHANRAANTTYGAGTDAEMCFNFLTYYPAMKGIGSCMQMSSSKTNNLAYCSSDHDPRVELIQKQYPNGTMKKESMQAMKDAGVLVNASIPVFVPLKEGLQCALTDQKASGVVEIGVSVVLFMVSLVYLL
ncbi:PHM/PNGase F domain-containing protein [Chytriomyces cf. hyalinus JEL632]|nr:PHM/PNGase F domain-containing protein [Chytriomyces cf. hyalinus JEL632]